MADAAPRLRRHEDLLAESVLSSGYAPAPLEAVPSLYSRVYDRLHQPLASALSMGAGTIGFILAVIALLIICGCCCCPSKKTKDTLFDRVASSMGGSIVNAAGLVIQSGRSGAYFPRQSQSAIHRSNPLLTVSPATGNSRLSIAGPSPTQDRQDRPASTTANPV